MKKLKDFEKEINKCSKCGLCQQACPIFQITGNECAVSKGKFIMLSGVIKGDIPFDKTLDKYLDLCTKCNKCSNFCPAGINVCEIFQTAKYEYLKSKFSFKILKLIQSNFLFDNIINSGKILSNFFRTKNEIHQAEILYFKGCVNQIFPKCENALKKILKKANILIEEADFSCCGQPFFSSGNLERFEEVKEKNTQFINKSNAKYILTDCASCESTLKNYKTIKNKEFITAENLITQTNLTFSFNKKQKIAYHKPCHYDNANFIKILKTQCKNIEFVEIPETCCGLAGDFFLKNHKISNQIAKQRANEILSSNAEIILTSCPACEIGLKKALIGTKIKVYNIIEFLAKADNIN